MRSRIARWGAVAALLALTLITALPSEATPITNPAFQRTWARTDKPVAEQQISRTWMWGPEANTPVMTESYAEAPGGQRQVQYFDKSRMEINDPDANPSSPWYVTNGLLVLELMTGRMQVGENTYVDRAPAQVNVAGDADDPTGPTYATLANLRGVPPLPDGGAITQRVNRAGQITNDPDLASRGVTAAYRVTVPGIDHQVASVFWTFMNSSGLVWENQQFKTAPLFENPFYATGYPVTEAYWANVKVGGAYKDVLLQCFERRCLTYTPGNPTGWQVEAGNVGLHYYTWRYQTPNPPAPTPTPTPPTTSVPTETSVIFQSSLTDVPEFDSLDGSHGGPTANGYQVVSPPDGELDVYTTTTAGDASYSLAIRKLSGSGDAEGCLTFREQESATQFQGYIYCLLYADNRGIGTLGLYVEGPLVGPGNVTNLGTFPLSPPLSASSWNTIKVIAQGSQLWFFVNGTLVGTKTQAGASSSSGSFGFVTMNTDESQAATLEFKDLVVKSLQPAASTSAVQQKSAWSLSNWRFTLP